MSFRLYHEHDRRFENVYIRSGTYSIDHSEKYENVLKDKLNVALDAMVAIPICFTSRRWISSGSSPIM
ncbi:predicted protein [Sclerotinia sclerotiorum 1980 UF-70]|uniref:Uncharacterized protein n=1 Tax=Sclerotinia sclerotiorum (strain ATCC 18683 / 1980 / Ss-1) TaxID=665079 RepID=A7ELV4_SCLS1|nr:predicted protein [Sclerotinia sclerotiorum 1980 UF-70]EDO03820.1 predicted protein [Sclerotinia sclerotiorum 1980 UF-70]